MSWPNEKVSVDLMRQAVQQAPLGRGSTARPQQEQAMHEHYGRRGYWIVEAVHDEDAARARDEA